MRRRFACSVFVTIMISQLALGHYDSGQLSRGKHAPSPYATTRTVRFLSTKTTHLSSQTHNRSARITPGHTQREHHVTSVRIAANQPSDCSGPYIHSNGTQYTIGNSFVFWTFDYDRSLSSGSDLGFPGDLYFDSDGTCNYSFTNIEGSIALSFVENGIRYVYGTPNGEYGNWWSANSSIIPANTITGSMTPTVITQESVPGQDPLVVRFGFLAGNARVSWVMSIGSTSISTPYSVTVTAPSGASISNVSLYHIYDLDDLNGGDSSPGADGLYQDGQLGSVNSLIAGIGISGYNANWDLSTEDDRQQNANDTFQKVVAGGAFDNYPEGLQYATYGSGADGGLQFTLGTLAAGQSVTVGGAGGGTRNYLTPPAPQIEANDENWIYTNTRVTPQPAASVTVDIKRFYGALQNDRQMKGQPPYPDYRQLAYPQFVQSANSTSSAATVQVEAYGINGQQGKVSVCTSQTACTDITSTGSWSPDPVAPGWSTFTSNLVPVSALNFPNLDLSSTATINPPHAAPNIVTVSGTGGGTAIAWARINVLGVRPVVLVHGIGIGLNANILRDGLGALFSSQNPKDLSGWSTWKCWVTTSSCSLRGTTSAGNYLASIGVPNILPSEENDTSAAKGPISDDPFNPGHYPSDVRVYLSTAKHFQDNAVDIRNHIAMVRLRYGVDSINVVTHSKGGLDSSFANLFIGSSIAHLVMLAVPYVGTDLADYVADRPILGFVGDVGFDALQDLTREYWETYAPAGIPPNPQTQIYYVAGTDPTGVVPSQLDHAAFGYDCIPFTVVGCKSVLQNDGAVPTYSVQETPGYSMGFFQDNHFNESQDPAIFSTVRDLLNITSVHPNRAYHSVPLQGASMIGHATVRQYSQTAQVLPQFGPLLSGSVQPSSTARQTVVLEASTTTHLTLLWDAGALRMVLIDPVGRTITPLSPGITYTETTNPSGGGTLDYELNSNVSGTWTAIITNTVSTGQPANFQLSASYVSPVTLSVLKGAMVYQPTSSVPFSVKIADSGSPVSSATVTATAVLTGATPIIRSLSLQDKGNGTYSGAFSTLPTPGNYTVHIAATGMVNGQPFALSGLSFFTVATGNASFTGSYSEQAVPGSYGLYSTLTIAPSIRVNAAGNYSLQGTLTDAAGDVVGTAGASAYLYQGTTRALALSFDGNTIGATGKNGPYQLRDLTLTDDSMGSVLTDDQVSLAYTTASYAASQFARPLVQILPGTQDMGTNPNALGQFQNLTVAFTATSALNDTYQVVATIESAQGHYITAVTQSVQLSSTPTEVFLQFSGAAIAAQHIDGPYSITGVTIVPNSSPTTYVSYPAFWVTQAYPSTQFGGPTPSTPTGTAMPTSTATGTAMPTVTPTGTAMPTSTATGTPMPTSTATPVSTITPTQAPTSTSIPPTATPIPPTATPIPPTSTPVPPTNTPVPPSMTPVPPTSTNTSVPPPTNTPLPPTNTSVPAIPTNTSVPAIPTNTSVPPANTPASATGTTVVEYGATPTSTARPTRLPTLLCARPSAVLNVLHGRVVREGSALVGKSKLETRLSGKKGTSVGLMVTLTYPTSKVVMKKVTVKGKTHTYRQSVVKPVVLVLYSRTVKTDRRGQAVVPLTITYAPAKATRVTLTMRTGTRCGPKVVSGAQTIHVTIMPLPHPKVTTHRPRR